MIACTQNHQVTRKTPCTSLKMLPLTTRDSTSKCPSPRSAARGSRSSPSAWRAGDINGHFFEKYLFLLLCSGLMIGFLGFYGRFSAGLVGVFAQPVWQHNPPAPVFAHPRLQVCLSLLQKLTSARTKKYQKMSKAKVGRTQAKTKGLDGQLTWTV